MRKLEDFLLEVDVPGRYIGTEYGMCDINKPYDVAVCLAFPDIYEIGMSNLGLKLLYNILNDKDNVLCERVYAPWIDFGNKLKESKISLFSLESQRPIKNFDVLGFSIQYEMAYTNILYMLELSEIPFYSKDRDETYPILIAGGPCSVNPEPFADFFDVVCIGEGEKVFPEIIDVYRQYKNNKLEFLQHCAKIEGVYVPSLRMTKDDIYPMKVKKAFYKDFKATNYIDKLVPNIRIVHDRPAVELFRGCYVGCRFCQACFFYRPIRAKTAKDVIKCMKETINVTGYEEMGVSSLSTSDYPEIIALAKSLEDLAEDKKIKIQLPSLRLDNCNKQLINLINQKSLTFAPEAGTQRLRNVINKNITEEDIKNTIEVAIEQGYKNIKLYFMIGLPTETDADLDGIVDICSDINKVYWERTGKKNLKISLSVAVFIPKPLTPFQWVEQISLDEMFRRQAYLRNKLKKIRNVSYSWHDAKTAHIEAVFARGDRRLSKLIERAYLLGAKFDAWGDHFKYDTWILAADELDIDLNEFTKNFDLKSTLPWDFIDFGVTKNYLIREYKKAFKEEITKPCTFNCNNCGANSDFSCDLHSKREINK